MLNKILKLKINHSFQLVSDLHLEYYNKVEFNKTLFNDFIIPSAPNLIIAGDIGYQHLDNYDIFMKLCSESFNKTFLVLGNHDYYCYKNNEILNMDEIETKIKTIIEKYDNIHLLLNNIFEFDNCVILGTTLWTDIPFNMGPYISKTINDYNYIYQEDSLITTNKTNYLHYNNVKWLEEMINKYSDKKIIIVTHHLPSFKLISEKYANNPMNYAFATNLEHLIKDNVVYFCSGHTHCSFNIKINNCTLLVNPKGYPYKNGKNENELYDKQFVFNIE